MYRALLIGFVFALSATNSGTGSLVLAELDTPKIAVSADTIDRMLLEIGTRKVDFMRMEITGSEREALQGAVNTLRRQRPRIMLGGYHRPDDDDVLPKLIRSANVGYRLICGPCEIADGRVVPHVLFFE